MITENTRDTDWEVRIAGMQQLQGLALGGETAHAPFRECLAKVKEALVGNTFHDPVYVSIYHLLYDSRWVDDCAIEECVPSIFF
jgi:hypothetical protein